MNADERAELIVVFSYFEPAMRPFITYVCGSATVDVLSEIEVDYFGDGCKQDYNAFFPNGPGDYKYIATHEEADIDEVGRMITNEYWSLQLQEYKPFPGMEEAQPHETVLEPTDEQSKELPF